jgi:hypothetical protein
MQPRQLMYTLTQTTLFIFNKQHSIVSRHSHLATPSAEPEHVSWHMLGQKQFSFSHAGQNVKNPPINKRAIKTLFSWPYGFVGGWGTE